MIILLLAFKLSQAVKRVFSFCQFPAIWGATSSENSSPTSPHSFSHPRYCISFFFFQILYFLIFFLLLLGNSYYIPSLSSVFHTIRMLGFLIIQPILHSEYMFSLEACVHIITFSASYITPTLLLFLQSLYLLPVQGFIFHSLTLVLLKQAANFYYITEQEK